MEELMNFAIGVAYRAGRLLKSSKYNHSYSKKNDFNDIGSYVSEMDKKSETLIRKMIVASYPDHNFCGEEGGLVDNGSEYTWYVDPLDGTYNYIRSFPNWGVSIGLAKNEVPVVGVLYFPDLDKLVYAAQGVGGYSNEKPINVSNLSYGEGCYTIPTYQYQGKQQANIQVIHEMEVAKIHHCSSFDFACIAEGNAELILSGTLAPWDSCAGVCVVREAGGNVVDSLGEPWKMSSNYLVAANQYYQPVIDHLKSTELELLEKNFLIPEINRKQHNYSDIQKLRH